MARTLRIISLLAALVTLVHGHGYLTDPPNRASMWRFGYGTPAHYDDDSFWCGGFQRQYEVFKGECGPCGDAMDVARPRPNENTGTYGRGIVTRRYRAGQEITVTVKLTTNHLGWFRFSLCRLNSASQLEENSCFSQNVLQLADGSGTEYKLPTNTAGTFTVRLRLPAGFTCSRCAMQWHYNTGNSWGVCANGQGGMGCGNQENFRSCADIAIDP